MPISIRRKHDPVSAPTDDDVTTRLLECHVRIRRFLEEAVAVARTEGGEARCASAASVRRYFTEALPLHADDEDRSVGSALGPELGSLVHRLAQEHDEIVATIGTLEPDWRRWAEGEADLAGSAHVDALAWLNTILLRHLAFEETELFPAIARLTSIERRRIVREMGARRSPSDHSVHRPATS